jgi:hypothetical protein
VLLVKYFGAMHGGVLYNSSTQRQRQKNLKSEASLGDRERPYLKKTNSLLEVKLYQSELIFLGPTLNSGL